MSDSKYDPTETGVFALDAMTPAESADFRRSMRGDEPTRAEATELTDTAIQLGLSVAPVEPSASLRASILGAIDNLPQEADAPQVDQPPPNLESPEPGRGRRGRLTGQPVTDIWGQPISKRRPKKH